MRYESYNGYKVPIEKLDWREEIERVTELAELLSQIELEDGEIDGDDDIID